MSLATRFTQWVTDHLPFIFRVLRTVRPIISFNGTTIVTRFDDVEETLARPDVFGVTYAEKMGVITNGGNFFLGMNNTAVYERDVSNMRLTMRRDDVDTIIAPMVEKFATEIMAEHCGEIDAVGALTGPVPARFVRDYLGVPGSSEKSLIDWATYMFWYLFFPDTSKETDEQAIRYAAQARDYIDGHIAARKGASGGQPDDVMARCLALQGAGTPGMTDTDIRNNLIGMLIGAIPTTSKCVVLVIDYLLNHPDLLDGAQKAARAGDTETVRQYVMEALRLNPFGPGVFRVATQDYTVAKGYWRSKTIKKGEKVLAATQSAMLDGRKLDSPNDFKLGRPDYHYMLFGDGMHRCSGYYINQVQIPIIVSALLKKKNLRRAEGEAGKIVMNGPFPARFIVKFDD